MTKTRMVMREVEEEYDCCDLCEAELPESDSGYIRVELYSANESSDRSYGSRNAFVCEKCLQTLLLFNGKQSLSLKDIWIAPRRRNYAIGR